MTNELNFHRATITIDGTEPTHISHTSEMTGVHIITLDRNNIEWDQDKYGRLLVGIDLTRPEREFTVGPYIITLDI